MFASHISAGYGGQLMGAASAAYQLWMTTSEDDSGDVTVGTSSR